LDRSAIARRGNGARVGERWAAVADAEERRGEDGLRAETRVCSGIRRRSLVACGRFIHGEAEAAVSRDSRVVWFAVGGARHATFPVISRSETFFAYFWLYAFHSSMELESCVCV
jgi:hypothetical protein